ncbi:small multidrug resistance pump [Moraxella cuniculi DSM 21768]|uniref:Small multidrug resistance pump n=1 Tax=Moraxella cuniculi DSM 21768 TaxID=1122245 RepID=A0A1N7DUH2_9GAMM|nr:SMR family transporter [Moraxella cuniculi]OOS07424.1 QacE family quaternary ammonium compound efflux SMR transporter [Moraxella cuniculi]SIR79460.1 small multidrug resistance pump [Moraxella cuniculi DSM 21768]
MNAWFLLGIAIIVEVIGSNSIKASDGFTKPIPTAIAIVAFVIALYLLSIITRTLPLGIVYAIWSGVGIVLTALVAFFLFGQKPDLAGFIGMAMIIGGVLVINLFSSSSAH